MLAAARIASHRRDGRNESVPNQAHAPQALKRNSFRRFIGTSENRALPNSCPTLFNLASTAGTPRFASAVDEIRPSLRNHDGCEDSPDGKG